MVCAFAKIIIIIIITLCLVLADTQTILLQNKSFQLRQKPFDSNSCRRLGKGWDNFKSDNWLEQAFNLRKPSINIFCGFKTRPKRSGITDNIHARASCEHVIVYLNRKTSKCWGISKFFFYYLTHLSNVYLFAIMLERLR